MKFPDFHYVRHRRDHLHRRSRDRLLFPYHDAPAVMPSGEDTRLYNYGVPMIGRSKLRFPASRNRSTRPEPDGRHCEKYEDSPGMRGQFYQFSLFQSVSVPYDVGESRALCSRVSESSTTSHTCHHLLINWRGLSSCFVMNIRKIFKVHRFKFEKTFFFAVCRLLNELNSTDITIAILDRIYKSFVRFLTALQFIIIKSKHSL